MSGRSKRAATAPATPGPTRTHAQRMTDYKRQRDELAKQTEALQAELAEQRGAAQRELDAERRKVDELNEAVLENAPS